MKWIEILKDIVLIVAIIILAFMYYRATKYRYVEPVFVEIHDTIETERIIEKTKLKYVTKYDTVIIITDTAANNLRDTIKLSLPIEHKEYRDTFNTDTTSLILDIKYSGFRSTIDGLEYKYTYQPTKPSQNAKKRGFGQGIGLSVSAGYGLSYYDKKIVPAPYIGIGVSYSIGYYKIR